MIWHFVRYPYFVLNINMLSPSKICSYVHGIHVCLIYFKTLGHNHDSDVVPASPRTYIIKIYPFRTLFINMDSVADSISPIIIINLITWDWFFLISLICLLVPFSLFLFENVVFSIPESDSSSAQSWEKEWRRTEGTSSWYFMKDTLLFIINS